MAIENSYKLSSVCKNVKKRSAEYYFKQCLHAIINVHHKLLSYP